MHSKIYTSQGTLFSDSQCSVCINNTQNLILTVLRSLSHADQINLSACFFIYHLKPSKIYPGLLDITRLSQLLPTGSEEKEV